MIVFRASKLNPRCMLRFKRKNPVMNQFAKNFQSKVIKNYTINLKLVFTPFIVPFLQRLSCINYS